MVCGERGKGERETLKRLSADTSLVIKPADKGSDVVVMDREQYVKDVNRQLEDQEFYRPLEEPIYMDSVDIIKNGYITKRRLPHKNTSGIHNITRDTKREEEKASWPFPNMPPGRPVVSDGVGEFIDFHLNHVFTKHTCYIKDTYNFLYKVRI